MLARLLSRLPSVRTERELAVARAEIEALGQQLHTSEQRRLELMTERNALRRQFDRLVEARLLKDGAIASTLTDPPPISKPSAPAALFGNISRLVDRRPAPDADDDLDSIPAGATMRP